MGVDHTAISKSDDVTEQPQELREPDQEITFYTVADERYFLGVVGLINSLRLTGHHNSLVVLDCGLNSTQRDLLSPHCTLFEKPRELVANPMKYKPFPYLLHPKGTVLIIDSDMIVTGTLSALVASAQQGNICMFPDPENGRWFGEWQELFALSNELRHQTYVNTGFLAFSTSHWPNLLERWWQSCERIFAYPTLYEGAPIHTNASALGDQDALNAILMSEVTEQALALQAEDEEVFRWNFYEVEVVDERTIACTFRGHPTKILHCCLSPKLWQSRAWREINQKNAYVRLLRRLLVGKDVAIKVSPRELPIWFRPGLLGQLSINGLQILNALLNRAQKVFGTA